MDTCKNCAGDGIVGAGEFPTQKAGPLSTCTFCEGKGKIETAVLEEPVIETPEEESPSEETQEPSEETVSEDTETTE